jgi:hypothetical protein
MHDTNIEHFEVRFASEADLDAVRGMLTVKAELGAGAALVSCAMMSEDEIIEAAAAAGVATPTISDSGITEEDMWPEWPEDCADGAERSYAAAF